MKLNWNLIAPSPDPNHGVPLSRSSHGVSAVHSSNDDKNNVRIYIYGGENVARTPMNDTQSTWCASQVVGENGNVSWKWTSVDSSSTKPPKRVGHAQCAVGSNIYMFGGRSGKAMGESALNDMWVLDCSIPGKEEWKEVTYSNAGSIAPPEPRSYHKMVSDGERHLYVFGGCGVNGRLADLHKFDLETKTWSNFGSSNLLAGRGGANFLLIDDGKKLAVVAGFVGKETSDGHVFNLESEKWEDEALDGLGSMRPRSVCVSDTVKVGNDEVGFIFGGEVDPSDKGHEGAGAFENDVILLDGTSAMISDNLKSESEGEWPQNRGWADGSAGKTGEFYLFGGLAGDDEHPERLGDLWKCTLSY